MSKEAALIPDKAVQYFDAFGGWAEGDETFTGRNRPGEAQITYYQRGRHIFGDLKIEILDQNGKQVDTVAGSKHRGLEPRQLVDAREGAGGSTSGDSAV